MENGDWKKASDLIAERSEAAACLEQQIRNKDDHNTMLFLNKVHAQDEEIQKWQSSASSAATMLNDTTSENQILHEAIYGKDAEIVALKKQLANMQQTSSTQFAEASSRECAEVSPPQLPMEGSLEDENILHTLDNEMRLDDAVNIAALGAATEEEEQPEKKTLEPEEDGHEAQGPPLRA